MVELDEKIHNNDLQHESHQSWQVAACWTISGGMPGVENHIDVVHEQEVVSLENVVSTIHYTSSRKHGPKKCLSWGYPSRLFPRFRWSFDGVGSPTIQYANWVGHSFIFFCTLILSFYHSHSPTDSCMFFCHCCRNCPPCPHNMSNKANENTPILQPTIKKENDGQYPLWVHKGYPKNCMPKQNRHNIFLSLGPLSYPSRYAARLPPSLGHKTREVLPVALWCVRVILADDVGVPLLDHLYIHWFWHHRCWEIPHAVDCFFIINLFCGRLTENSLFQ